MQGCNKGARGNEPARDDLIVVWGGWWAERTETLHGQTATEAAQIYPWRQVQMFINEDD